MTLGTPSVGDHVRLREDRVRWLAGRARADSFGIVRETHYGLLSSDVTVELADGSGILRMPAHHLRRTGGFGERGFRLARDWHQAKLFAGCLLALPVVIAMVHFLLAGGQPSELILPLLKGAVETFLGILGGPFGGIVAAGLAIAVASRMLRH